MRNALVTALAALCLVAAVSQSASAQGTASSLTEADLPLETLIDAPPRVYHLRLFALSEKPAPNNAEGKAFSINPQEVGKLSVATRRFDNGDGLELIDRLDADLGTKTVTRIARCRPDSLLTPMRVRIESGDGEGEPAVTRAVLDGNRMEVDPPSDEEKPRRHDWPAGTLTLSTLIRITPLLPRDPDAAFTVDGFVELFEFEPATPPRGESFVLQAVGVESLRIGRRDYRCTRYLLDLKNSEQNISLWVDRDGVLRQFVVGRQLRATLGEPGPIQNDPIYNELLDELKERSP